MIAPVGTADTEPTRAASLRAKDDSTGKALAVSDAVCTGSVSAVPTGAITTAAAGTAVTFSLQALLGTVQLIIHRGEPQEQQSNYTESQYSTILTSGFYHGVHAVYCTDS